jgi:hypothetical protein
LLRKKGNDMQKSAKKLVLHRETLRDLEEPGLRKIAGGKPGPTGIDCSVTFLGASPTADCQ